MRVRPSRLKLINFLLFFLLNLLNRSSSTLRAQNRFGFRRQKKLFCDKYCEQWKLVSYRILTACFPTPYATLNRYLRPPTNDMLTMSPIRRGTIIRDA